MPTGELDQFGPERLYKLEAAYEKHYSGTHMNADTSEPPAPEDTVLKLGF